MVNYNQNNYAYSFFRLPRNRTNATIPTRIPMTSAVSSKVPKIIPNIWPPVSPPEPSLEIIGASEIIIVAFPDCPDLFLLNVSTQTPIRVILIKYC